MLPEIERRRDGSGAIFFPFSREFIEDLKVAVPPAHRTYIPERKTWHIDRSHIAVVERLMRDRWEEVVITGEELEPAEARFTVINGSGGDPDLRALHLRDDAPPEVVDAAYRALSRLHHPDLGGDLATMQRISAAYGRLLAARREGAAS